MQRKQAWPEQNPNPLAGNSPAFLPSSGAAGEGVGTGVASALGRGLPSNLRGMKPTNQGRWANTGQAQSRARQQKKFSLKLPAGAGAGARSPLSPDADDNLSPRSISSLLPNSPPNTRQQVAAAPAPAPAAAPAPAPAAARAAAAAKRAALLAEGDRLRSLTPEQRAAEVAAQANAFQGAAAARGLGAAAAAPPPLPAAAALRQTPQQIAEYKYLLGEHRPNDPEVKDPPPLAWSPITPSNRGRPGPIERRIRLGLFKRGIPTDLHDAYEHRLLKAAAWDYYNGHLKERIVPLDEAGKLTKYTDAATAAKDYEHPDDAALRSPITDISGNVLRDGASGDQAITTIKDAVKRVNEIIGVSGGNTLTNDMDVKANSRVQTIARHYRLERLHKLLNAIVDTFPPPTPDRQPEPSGVDANLVKFIKDAKAAAFYAKKGLGLSSMAGGTRRLSAATRRRGLAQRKTRKSRKSRKSLKRHTRRF